MENKSNEKKEIVEHPETNNEDIPDQSGCGDSGGSSCGCGCGPSPENNEQTPSSCRGPGPGKGSSKSGLVKKLIFSAIILAALVVAGNALLGGKDAGADSGCQGKSETGEQCCPAEKK